MYRRAEFESTLPQTACCVWCYESGMSVPPESGGYYGYKLPSNNVEPTLEVTGTQRRCTVKGCQRPIELESPNKMCESCRGKHRIYASTKRARRKLEKAAVSGQTVVPVEQIPGSAAWMPRPEDQEPEVTILFAMSLTHSRCGVARSIGWPSIVVSASVPSRACAAS